MYCWRKLIVEQVVPKESSALNERKYEIKEFINSNHMDMCRFKSRTDDGYKKVLFAINLYVGQIKEKVTPTAERGLVCAPSNSYEGVVSAHGEQVSTGEKNSDRRSDPICT